MSDFLMIGGARVPIAAPNGADEEYQELGGEVVRSFSGRLLSTVKGRARVWRLQTPPLPESEAQMLVAALAHGSPLMCSGALIGSAPVSCYARGVRTRPVAPLSRLRRVVEFELHEAAPMASPILFRLHAGDALPPGVSFSRASTATYIDRDGILREAGPDVPRIDWSHGRPALRLEGSRTNGWTWSEDLSQSVWNKDGVSVMADVATAPDGQVTMDKVVEDATTGVHQIRRALSGASDNAKQAISFWVAAAERTWVRIGTNGKDSTSVTSSYFNLATGEFGTVSPTHSLRIIERAGSAYRLECVFDVSSGAETPQFRVAPAPGNAIAAYTGDGTSGIYLWGLSFEADQPFASSYIQTEGSTVTRSADLAVADVTGTLRGQTRFALYLRQIERGTIVVRDWARALAIQSGSQFMHLWTPGIGTNVYEVWFAGFGASYGTRVGGTPQVGQQVEHLIRVDGGTVTIEQSIEGGPIASASATGGFSGFSGTVTLAMGSDASGANHGQIDVLDVLALRGADWTMDDVRRLVR